MGWQTGAGWQGIAVVPGTLTVGDAVVVSSTTQSGSAAFQAGNFDFNVGAGFGSSTATAPVYGAGVMGNILGSALTATQNILAGVIGKYTITSTNASVLGKAGVIGEVGNLSDTADAAVLAVLGGDTGTSTPGAAFGVMSLNSTAASKFDYGVDLYRAAVGSYQAITYGSAAIRLPNAEWIVGRNAADSADVNMFRLTSGNIIDVGTTLRFTEATIARISANVLAQQNGSVVQEFRVYGSGTAFLAMSDDGANNSEFRRNATGTIYFTPLSATGTGSWRMSGTSGGFEPYGDNLQDFGITGSSRIRSAYFGTSVVLESAANGALLGIKRATTTVNTTNLAASITATNLIPAGSVVFAVVTRNTVVFNGTMSSFDIGDGTTVDLFANNTSLAAGDTTDLTDHLATFQPTLYPAATSVVVTAVGGTFGTTGTIRITVFYYDSTAPTS